MGRISNPSRGRRTRARCPGWLASAGALPIALLAAIACGRIGYDLLPLGTTSPPRGTGGRDGGISDASLGDSRAGASGTGAAGGAVLSGGAGGASGSGGAGGTSSGGRVSSESGAGASSSGGARADSGAPDANPCRGPVAAIADYCTELPALGAPPVIDGALDCGLALQDFAPEGWAMTTPADASSTTPDATAKYAVAWRPDGLYFYVLVQDSTLIPSDSAAPTYEGDGVELYADSDGTYTAPPLYDNPGTRQFTTVAPLPSTPSVSRAEVWWYGSGGGSTPWTSTAYAAFQRPGGYALEAFVAAADLLLSSWTLSAGKKVGFDLAVDVSYSDPSRTGTFGHRLGQYFLHLASTPDGGASVFPFLNSGAFCNPELLAP